MKTGIIFTGSGPILVLTSFSSFSQEEFAQKLVTKGIEKFIAYELPLDMIRDIYGAHYQAVLQDVGQSDDLRVLDYDGHHIFNNFAFSTFGEPIFVER